MNGAMWRSVAVAGLMAGAGLYAAPAAAQTGSMTRTWVSGTTAGNDGNPCTRTQPCATFNGALAKTAPGGEVNCVDSGGFGTINITASVSIICHNVEAGIIATSSTVANGVVINGANAVVTLSGLDIDGFNSGTNGVLVNNAAAVTLDNVKVRNFTGYGVRFEPSSTATLTVTKSLLSGNGNTSAPSGGLYAHPAASARVTVSDTQLVNNVVDGARFESVSGTFNATVVDSIASGNGSAGLRFRGVGSNVATTVNGVTLANNTAYGLVASGTGATVSVGDATVTGNGIGVGAAAGATVSTFGDNRLAGNTANGGFSGSQVKQ